MSEHFISGSDALVFFYAVFWALVFIPAARFRAFDTQLLFTPRWCQVLPRILVALTIVNVAPLAWFMFLYEHVVPHSDDYRSVVAAGIASLSLPGFQRFLHAFLLTNYSRWFYSRRERRDILAEWKRNRADRVSRHFNAFFVPGIGYLVLATGAAEIILGRAIGWRMVSLFIFPLIVWRGAPREPLLGIGAGLAVLMYVIAATFDQTILKEIAMHLDATAIGTWIIALGTIALAYTNRGLVDATRRGMGEQNRITQQESRLRILLQYEDRFDSLVASRQRLALLLRTPGWRYENIADDIPNLFESLGALARREAVDVDMVDAFFGYYACHYHFALRRYLEEDRRRNNDQRLWRAFYALEARLIDYEATADGVPVEQVRLRYESNNDRFLEAEATLRVDG